MLQKVIAFNHLVELNAVNRAVAASAMGFFYYVQTWKAQFNPYQFLIGLVGIFLVLCYIMALNDCMDVEDDLIKSRYTGKKIIVSKEISVRDALLLSLIMLFLGIAISLFVSVTFLIVILMIVGLSTLYSVPPVRYKRIFPLGTFGECVGALLPFLSGYAILGFVDVKALTVATFFATVTIFLRFHHEYTFHEVDRKTGKMTFAVVLGPKKAYNIGRLCLLLGILESLILFFFGWFSFHFLILQCVYLLFGLGLLIRLLKTRVSENIADYSPVRSASRVPKFIRKVFEDQIVPLWGFVLLIIVIAFLIS